MPPTHVIIKTDDGLEMLTDVADVAEMLTGRVQCATLSGDREKIDGTIFGAYGRWKLWHENTNGEIEKFVADTPLTMPDECTRFRYHHDQLDCLLKTDRSGRIKRLKRADL